jgi:hypothetical protein
LAAQLLQSPRGPDDARRPVADRDGLLCLTQDFLAQPAVRHQGLLALLLGEVGATRLKAPGASSRSRLLKDK